MNSFEAFVKAYFADALDDAPSLAYIAVRRFGTHGTAKPELPDLGVE
jgi:hypothetical protein